MMDMIEKKIYADGEPYYFNTETTEKYGEIAGGLAWPEAKEGFLVIAAVDSLENTELESRHIRVIAQTSESNIEVFLKRALELQRQFSPFMETIRFYGDTTSLAMMELLDQFNRDRRHRVLDPFYLTEAPQLKGPQKLEFYAQLIRRYTQPGRKVLHFCDTALPSYLVSLSTDEISKAVLDHPPVAALGYALAVLSTWRPRKRETEVKAKCERILTGKTVRETTWQFKGTSELPK
ncbi:MAG: hypothetical protein ABSG71_21125 [Thermodesulfobacteriota bacterium]|jgi:hypothetical protein